MPVDPEVDLPAPERRLFAAMAPPTPNPEDWRTLDTSLHELAAMTSALKELVFVKDKALRDLLSEKDHAIRDLLAERDRRWEERDIKYDIHFAESDKRYTSRFEAQEVALKTALNSSDQLHGAVTAAAKEAIHKAELSHTHLQAIIATAAKDAIEKAETAQRSLTAASKEAIQKAEAAQSAVNERQNEFRGQLSDQAATLMPRKEAEAAVHGVRELLDREVKTLRLDISSLRESRSEGTGAEGNRFQSQQSWGMIFGVISTIIAVGSVIVTITLYVK